MKTNRILTFILTTLLLNLSFSFNLPFYDSFRVEVFDDSNKKPSSYLLADIYIEQQASGLVGLWQNIGIYPNSTYKDTILKREEFSIVNISNYESAIEFDVVLEVGAFLKSELDIKKDRTIHVIIKKDNTKYGGHSSKGNILEGNAVWWSPILNENISKKWKSTNKDKIRLEYPDVY